MNTKTATTILRVKTTNNNFNWFDTTEINLVGPFNEQKPILKTQVAFGHIYGPICYIWKFSSKFEEF